MNHVQKVLPVMRRQVAAASSPFHSFSEPSFVYRGWHKQSRSTIAMNHRSTSSYHFEESGNDNFVGTHKMRDFRVMSPKEASSKHQLHDDSSHPSINYDEDYDEFNLHIASHLVNSQSQQQLHGLDDALEHKNIYNLSDVKGDAPASYFWDEDNEIKPNEWFNGVAVAPVPASEDYDDASSSVDDGEIAWDH